MFSLQAGHCCMAGDLQTTQHHVSLSSWVEGLGPSLTPSMAASDMYPPTTRAALIPDLEWLQ